MTDCEYYHIRPNNLLRILRGFQLQIPVLTERKEFNVKEFRAYDFVIIHQDSVDGF